MRMRLGILHDPIAQERMHERELKVAEEKKRKAEVPIVRTEAEQKKFEEEQAKAEKDGPKKDTALKVKIRPLSEAKAIDLGANFFSEAFIFAVAAGLLVWDAWRSRKKESVRRDEVAERLETLEAEVARLRGRFEPELKELPEKLKPVRYPWYNPAGWWTTTEPVDVPGEVEGVQGQAIAGDVPGLEKDKAVKPVKVEVSALEEGAVEKSDKPAKAEMDEKKVVEESAKDGDTSCIQVKPQGRGEPVTVGTRER